MKKTFNLEDLDCANCARKMQEAISKIDGVSYVSVNYMAQRLVLEADDLIFEQVLAEAVKAIRKVEPDCSVLL